MDPIAYNMVDPMAAVMNGLKTGAGITGIQQDREDRALKMAKEQAAQRAAMQQQADLGDILSNPMAGHKEYAAYALKYPQIAEEVGKAWALKSDGEKQNLTNYLARGWSALAGGKPEVAATSFRERAKADPQNAQHLNVIADVIDADPKAGMAMLMPTMAAVYGDKFATAFPALGGEQRAVDKAPAELAKANADATTAQADAVIKTEQAKVAPQAALLDLEKKGWDIKKIKADIDIAREDNRIKAMNAAISRQGNDLKRKELELKVAEAEEKLTGKIREKVATAEAGATNIDNMLNTVERIMANKSLDDVLGSIEGRVPGSVGSLLDDEESDAIALIETLGSQAFLAQIPNIKGMGALSNAEGEKLQSALQNLSRSQSEKGFRASLNEAARLLKKGRKNIERSTGVPLPKPDTPAAPGARPPLSDFEKK